MSEIFFTSWNPAILLLLINFIATKKLRTPIVRKLISKRLTKFLSRSLIVIAIRNSKMEKEECTFLSEMTWEFCVNYVRKQKTLTLPEESFITTKASKFLLSENIKTKAS